MIRLKNKINKSVTFRELEKKAFEMYKDCYDPEESVKDFMRGAEELFKLLRLGVVGCSFCGGREFRTTKNYKSAKKML